MASITFTGTQISTLQCLTANGTANFYAGYDFLRAELEALTEVELAQMGVTTLQVEECVFWLTRASTINQNDLSSEANNFIRDVTRYGLLYDGKPAGTIQLNSNAIGEAVIGHVLQNTSFPPIDSIVGNDVQAAISDGGQSVAGWGGAFYYWDAPYEDDGVMSTVGNAILGDPAELEKFISVATSATYNSIVRLHGDTYDTGNIAALIESGWMMLGVLSDADVPSYIKDEIMFRTAEYLLHVRDHGSWETSIDLSNAVGLPQPGQHGFDINLITGNVEGFHFSNENFETFATIVKVRGSNFGDLMVLDGNTPFIEVKAGGGDDRVFATGGVVSVDGGGGTDDFIVNANFTDVDIIRAFDQIIINGLGADFSYFLSDFDFVQFYDVIKDFAQLLADTVQNIDGTALADTIYGSNGNDVIYGAGGNDTIYGNGGNDRIYGGAGNDIVYGGAGSDAMFGEGDSDTFYLGDGRNGDVDYINGGAGSDVLNVSVSGQYRIDAVGASAIRNAIAADGFTAPTGHGLGLNTGVGDAFIQGVERVNAAAAANEILISNLTDLTTSGVQIFDFSSGNMDVARFVGEAGAQVSLSGENGASRAVWTNSTSPVFLGIDDWFFTPYADRVTVSNSHVGTHLVTLNGGSDDTLILTSFTSALEVGDGVQIGAANIIAHGFYRIETGAGDDIFHGSDADSHFKGGGGTNTFHASLGADTLISSGNLIIDYSASGAALLFSGYSDRSAYGSTANVLSMAAGDVLKTSGWSDITGSAYDDTLVVVGQYGILRSGGGNDRLTGLDKGDTLVGADGYAEIMTPGNGNDIVQFGTGGGELNFASTNFAADIDMAAGTYLFGIQFDTISGEYDKLVGTDYNDVIRGTDQADTIDGGYGNSVDTIHGRGGDDVIRILRGTVYGGAGSDTITSSYSATIFGDGGDDTITAGTGSVVYGGDGNDAISARAGSFVYGEGGDDALTATYADVVLIGGSGADTFNFTGNIPNSTLSYSTSNAAIALRTVAGSTHGFGADAAGDVIHGRFHIVGSNFADDIRLAGYQYMEIRAGAGDDYIEIAQNTNVTIFAGDGADEIILKRAQTAYGDDDDDIFRGVGTMNGGHGNDEFYLDLDYYLSTSAGSIGGIQTWAGGTLNGGSGSNIIHGGGGDDRILMSEGSDTFIFSSGGRKDVIIGAGSDDVIRLDGILAFSGMSDASERLQQVGNNVLLDFGLMSDHEDVYGEDAPDDFIGSIQFNGMTIAQVAALSWEFV